MLTRTKICGFWKAIIMAIRQQETSLKGVFELLIKKAGWWALMRCFLARTRNILQKIQHPR